MRRKTTHVGRRVCFSLCTVNKIQQDLLEKSQKHFSSNWRFVNILEAEKRHIQALLLLFRKYKIPIPVDNWAEKVKVPASVAEACQMGVAAEIENGEMYQRLLALTSDYPDVRQVFLNL